MLRSTAGTLDSPLGEVVAIASEHDDAAGTKRGPNTIFCFALDGLRFCHFGDFGQSALRAEQRAAIGEVDVLFLPVGDGPTVGGERAAAIVRALRPRLVVPMHYRTEALSFLDPPDAFLEALGARVERLAESEFAVESLLGRREQPGRRPAGGARRLKSSTGQRGVAVSRPRPARAARSRARSRCPMSRSRSQAAVAQADLEPLVALPARDERRAAIGRQPQVADRSERQVPDGPQRPGGSTHEQADAAARVAAQDDEAPACRGIAARRARLHALRAAAVACRSSCRASRPRRPALQARGRRRAS